MALGVRASIERLIKPKKCCPECGSKTLILRASPREYFEEHYIRSIYVFCNNCSMSSQQVEVSNNDVAEFIRKWDNDEIKTY